VVTPGGAGPYCIIAKPPNEEVPEDPESPASSRGSTTKRHIKELPLSHGPDSDPMSQHARCTRLPEEPTSGECNLNRTIASRTVTLRHGHAARLSSNVDAPIGAAAAVPNTGSSWIRICTLRSLANRVAIGQVTLNSVHPSAIVSPQPRQANWIRERTESSGVNNCAFEARALTNFRSCWGLDLS
jgi:hypothetical protein